MKSIPLSGSEIKDAVDRYPRAIVHVDGDAFFASCEVARDPSLKGKPVIVGGIRGIAVALTYEAKARGVVRGMPVFQILKLCPDAVILPGDYDLYAAYAQRMYRIVKRHSACVEEYSIDECFADITDEPNPEAVARTIKYELESELGVTFSVGLATTKVLAKVASKHSKPSGLVFIPHGSERSYLEKLSIGKVWGIGPATARKLHGLGILTALEFCRMPEWQLDEQFAKPHRALWYELRGVSVLDVDVASHDDQKSIASTRTFRPPTKEKSRVWAELAKNVETACRRAREKGLVSRHLYCFLKSQEFQYRRFDVTLTQSTNLPSEVLTALAPAFEDAFARGVSYRATGITLADLTPYALRQDDLFGGAVARTAESALWSVIDRLGGSVHLAASMSARVHRVVAPTLGLPYMGEVT
jgi:DNA polymerase-4/DNA polymerase V